MSPEQLTVGGAPGPLTDLWSLGACAFTAMTARIPFEGDVLGDIVLKVCVSPVPVPSQYNPKTPLGFDAWFAKACSRDPAKRFQSAAELSLALEIVCGVASQRGRALSLDEVGVQYALRPAAPDAFSSDDIEVPSSMSPRTALLAGLVLGVAVMIGLVGALAWRQRELEAGSENPENTTSTEKALPSPPVVSNSPADPTRSALDASKTDAAGR
jgi:serine/threonine-protein kinase